MGRALPPIIYLKIIQKTFDFNGRSDNLFALRVSFLGTIPRNSRYENHLSPPAITTEKACYVVAATSTQRRSRPRHGSGFRAMVVFH
jgi:hypothetical protein